ncbi:uncharacterized protein LOC124453249 [Xenia sp. Carnegie-2017]|uniref:uncharacterized protein LOC124453249 n=1 Tax=Xenia sp. Carnegie-2017 TaxID=2897299 RepID=UPI001F03AF0D|nr:uncharacterized protein LOC124453249 [Xenia sp. Carnegie-2017]
MTIILIQKCNFELQLPAGISWNPAKRKITVDDSYTVLTNDEMVLGEQKTNDGQRNALLVNNNEDLEATRSLILSKPLVMTVKCPAEDAYYVTCLVIVDTSSAQVKSVFDKAFDLARQLLVENRKFVVTFNLNKTISRWYHETMFTLFNNESTCYGANFYIAHNATEQCILAQEYMDCYRTQGLCCWCWCFPCCLVIGCPYMIYRNLVRKIKDVKVSPNFNVSLGSFDDFEKLPFYQGAKEYIQHIF